MSPERCGSLDCFKSTAVLNPPTPRPLSPGPPPPPALRGLQACGFYPQVGRLLPLPAHDRKARSAVLTRKDERVRIHPSSVNAK